MVRPIRQNRAIHGINVPENQPLPVEEEAEGPAVDAQLNEAVQQVLGDQVLVQEGPQPPAAEVRFPVQQAPQGQPQLPRRNRRRLQPNMVDFDSDSSAEIPPVQPPRNIQAQNEASEDDELDLALKRKKSTNGKWQQHLKAFSHSEAVLCSNSSQALLQIPELLASLPKNGGACLEQHLHGLRNLWTSWDAVNSGLKFRGLAGKDLEKAEKVASASAGMFRSFLDTFTPISSAPGALSGIIAFFEDDVHRALLGQDNSNSLVQQLRAFSRVQRSIAAVSFSSLCRWRPKSVYRAENNKPGRYQPYSNQRGSRYDAGQGSSSSSNFRNYHGDQHQDRFREDNGRKGGRDGDRNRRGNRF